MSLINGAGFAAGLSSAGAAVAQTAGTAALALQKSQLDQQAMSYGSQLKMTEQEQAEALGERGAGVASGLRQTEATQQHGFRTSEIGQQIAGETNIETSREKANLDIARLQTATTTADVMAQIAAQSKEVSIDAKTGSAMIVDKSTGKSSPLTGADGSPVYLPNSAQSTALQQVINSTNEQLRSAVQSRNQDVRSAQSQLDDVSKRADLIGDDKTAALATAQKNLTAIQSQHDVVIAQLRHQMETATSALVSMTPPGANGAIPTQPTSQTPSSPSSRPPLGSFDKGTGGN